MNINFKKGTDVSEASGLFYKEQFLKHFLSMNEGVLI